MVPNLETGLAQIGQIAGEEFQLQGMFLPIVETDSVDFVACPQQMQKQARRIHATTQTNHGCAFWSAAVFRIFVHVFAFHFAGVAGLGWRVTWLTD